MATASGHKTAPDKVHLHLPHRGCGDRKTGECILLKKKKITQDEFGSVQFFRELISFSTRWYMYRISSLPCRFLLLYIEIKSHLSPTFFSAEKIVFEANESNTNSEFCPLSA